MGARAQISQLLLKEEGELGGLRETQKLGT